MAPSYPPAGGSLRKDVRLPLLHIIILAAVQGITEFLPISSSGHLVMTWELFDRSGWQVPETTQSERLILDVAVPNQRAIRCYERLGFVTTGSHWQVHSTACDPSADRQYRDLPDAFRRRGMVLEVRFLDMEIDPARFLAANGDLAKTFQIA